MEKLPQQMWHKHYAVQSFPILLLHTYTVKYIVNMKAYYRPLTDILETLLCSGLLTTYQCTGTYHTNWILLEICFISHTEQQSNTVLRSKLAVTAVLYTSSHASCFSETHSLPKINFHSLNEVTCQDKSESSVSHFGLTCRQEGSRLEYSYLRREKKKFLCPLTCMMLH